MFLAIFARLFGGLTAGGLFSSMSAVVVAIVSAIPAVLTAAATFLKAVGESPVLSLLFGAAVGGVLAFLYGLSFDAPIRARYKADAIRVANQNADKAILKIRADYERQIAELTRKNKQAKR